MNKLLFIIPTLNPGGAERVLVNLVNALDKKRYSITILCILEGGELKNDIQKNVEVQSLIKTKNPRLRKLYYYLLSFYIPGYLIDKLFVKEKYDYKIAYLSGLPAKIVSSSRTSLTKKIAFIHTDFSKNYRLSKFYKDSNECLIEHKNFNTVVFVSNQAKVGFETSTGILKNAVVIQNYNDNDRIRTLAHEAINEKKVNKILFVSVGRLDYVKGYDRLIEAVTLLGQEGYDFEVWIIGAGNEKENLEKSITNYDLTNVKLIGHKPNPYPYILASDFFICSSRAEGFSTVVSEAIILHKPVVTTNCAGMDEILNNGEYGMIVENSNKGIYEGMKRILTNPELIDFFGQKAHERSVYFSEEAVLEKYYDLFG